VSLLLSLVIYHFGYWCIPGFRRICSFWTGYSASHGTIPFLLQPCFPRCSGKLDARGRFWLFCRNWSYFPSCWLYQFRVFVRCTGITGPPLDRHGSIRYKWVCHWDLSLLSRRCSHSLFWFLTVFVPGLSWSYYSWRSLNHLTSVGMVSVFYVHRFEVHQA